MSFACRFLSCVSAHRECSHWSFTVVFGTFLGVAACGDADEDHALSCDSQQDQITYVNAAMHEYYLWSEELPEVDLEEFDTPENLLDALRYKDDPWSRLSSKPKYDDFYAGVSVGWGGRMVWVECADGVTRPRISLVYEDSPAETAGLERGMTVLAINDKTIEEIQSEGIANLNMGPEEVGVQMEFRVARVDGTEFETQVEKAENVRSSVFLTEVLPVGDRRVGYLMFDQFITPSQEALASAFRQLAEGDATDLVLDLRYNTGGLLDVARYLASLIAGPGRADQIFLRFDYNARRSSENRVLTFGRYAEAIVFERVAFLVTGSTASASEALINGLRPYIDVHLVGSNTAGKPVGANPYEFCDKILQPITFAVNNARREGGYFGGIAPDCSVGDDLDFQLGDPNEAQLAAALAWLGGNPCPREIVANDGGVLSMPFAGQAPPRPDPLVRGPGIAGYYGVL